MKTCPSCSKENLDDVQFCGGCGKAFAEVAQVQEAPKEKSKRSMGCIFIDILIVANVSEPEAYKGAEYGTEGTLEVSGVQQIPICKTLDDYEQFSDLAKSKDVDSVQQMIIGGRVFMVELGTRVKVIKTEPYGMRKVRLMDGREGYIRNIAIKPLSQ